MNENQAPNPLVDEIPSRAAYPSHEARVLLGGISESTFRRFVKSGELDAFKLRTKVYVTGTEIARFLATRPSARKVA